VTLEYEVHNFDTNERPRNYEAVYTDGEALIIKAVVRQQEIRTTNRKPAYRWRAYAFAWTPGQSDDDWTQLAHLGASDITIRDIVSHEATEDDWLSAAQYDAQKLIDRARPFATVLSNAMKSGGKRRLKAA
jgi:hypothetical protein